MTHPVDESASHTAETLNTPSEKAVHHILVVDDDDVIREGLVNYLSYYHTGDYALEVDSAATVLEAKAKLANAKLRGAPTYSIVISDINLPDGDGFQVLQSAQNDAPECKTALITAYKVEDYVLNAKRTGICNIIAKTAPFNFDELSRLVDNLIHPESAFGLEHYLKPNTPTRKLTLATSHDIMSAYSTLKAYLNDNHDKISPSQINDLLTASVEAMTNAVYHVHKTSDGSLKYEKGHPIEKLEDHEQVFVEFGQDQNVIGISIADQGGGMDAQDVLYWLERNISGSGLMDTHGRGVYLMHRLVDRLLINIHPGERTEVLMFHYVGQHVEKTANKPVYINQF